MLVVIKRRSDGKYVQDVEKMNKGDGSSYTDKLQNARTFKCMSSANKEACKNNEVGVYVKDELCQPS